MSGELWVVDCGTVDYDAALALQQRLHAARVEGAADDMLLLLEHPPVYTCGRRTTPDELPFGTEWYRERGIELRDVDRGGKVTYHGPGQLVAYPIVSTELFDRDIDRLVGALEGSIVAALAETGIVAGPDPAGRGVWAGEAKIGSIGLHIAQNVTTHGLMVNVCNDLEPFSWIKPCGLDAAATSISEQLGKPGGMRCFKRRIALQISQAFGLRQRLLTPEGLERRIAVRSDDLVFSA